MIEFSSSFILSIRQRALRSRIWFKALNSAERAILTLAPKCVDAIKSPLLVDAVAKIIVKVAEALRSPLERFRSQVAAPLAEKISLIAQKWGNTQAKDWAFDKGFVQYLAVCKFNDVTVFR
ncbi:hypothetical protein KEJ15_06390 [Candidatus Bathyarchaeota archaeon]|nr:hypothetical protein [Candidatus Bathyarchaeota archaeon]